jgi:hypothetical protein
VNLLGFHLPASLNSSVSTRRLISAVTPDLALKSDKFLALKSERIALKSD